MYRIPQAINNKYPFPARAKNAIQDIYFYQPVLFKAAYRGLHRLSQLAHWRPQRPYIKQTFDVDKPAFFLQL